MATKTATKASAQPKYTAAEFARASEKVFGVSQDIVTAALHMAGKQTATVEEAKKIVKEFASKEVK